MTLKGNAIKNRTDCVADKPDNITQAIDVKIGNSVNKVYVSLDFLKFRIDLGKIDSRRRLYNL